MKLFEVPRSGPEPYENLPDPGESAYFQARASAAGADFKQIAKEWVEQAGGTIEADRMMVGVHPVDALVRGINGSRYLLLARGTPDGGPRAGLRRTDTVLKMGCRAVLIARRTDLPLLVVTSHLPTPTSRSGRILADLHKDIFDVVATEGDLGGFHRLHQYFTQVPRPTDPLPAPWRSRHAQESLFDRGGTDA
jgi:hypothetical protein